MQLDGSHTLEIPALGRNFQLGGLYDSRTETIVPGFSLWDKNQLEAPNLSVTYNNHTSYALVASDKLSEKLRKLEVSGSLQLSILSGLIDMKGSSTFLTKKQNTHRESSVYVRCHHRTLVKSLTMNHLGKGRITHLDVAQTGAKNSATHVVIQIQYGADATFTFRNRSYQTGDEKEVSGKLTACGENLIKVLSGAPTGQGDAACAADKNDNNADIECHFEGDFKIPCDMVTPTNYEEAIKFAGGFSQFLSQSTAKDTTPGNEGIGLPCFVTLYPLVKLLGVEDAPSLQYDIRDSLTSECVCFMEHYEELEDKVQDLLHDSLASIITPFREKLKFFLKQFTLFRNQFKMKLKGVLIQIRSGQHNDAVLEQLLERIRDEQFVFNPRRIELWLTEKQAELLMVKRFRDKLTAQLPVHEEDGFLIFPTEGKSREHMTASTARCAIHFVFTLLSSPESFLQLAEKAPSDITATSLTVPYVDDDLRWHTEHETIKWIEEEMLDYIQFVQNNKGDAGVVFAMTALETYDDTCVRGSSVFVYENGLLSKKNYQLPGIPYSVSIEWHEDLSHRVGFSHPVKGENLRYRITHPRAENCHDVSSFVDEPCYVLPTQDALAMRERRVLEFTMTAVCPYGSGPSHTASLLDATMSPESGENRELGFIIQEF